MPWLTPWWTRARSNCPGGIFCARRARRGRAPALCRRRWGTYVCDVTHSHETSRDMMRFVLFLRGVLDKESLSPCVGTVAHICVTLSTHMRNCSFIWDIRYYFYFFWCVCGMLEEKELRKCVRAAVHICVTLLIHVCGIFIHMRHGVIIHMWAYLFICTQIYSYVWHYLFMWCITLSYETWRCHSFFFVWVQHARKGRATALHRRCRAFMCDVVNSYEMTHSYET